MNVRSTMSDCAAKYAGMRSVPLKGGGLGTCPPQENFQFLVFVNHISEAILAL